VTPSRADALAVGGWLALVARGPTGMRLLSRIGRPVTLATGSLLVALFVWRRGLTTEDPYVQTIGFSLLALFFGGLVSMALVAGAPSRLGRVFAHPILTFLGRYSYGLYVFHHPVAIYLGASAVGVAAFPRVFGSQLVAQGVFIALATAVSLAVAVTSWHLWESPFLRLKRFFRPGT
jgi:peptidoglycan/LPS O-acetylase OafA/YrhL